MNRKQIICMWLGIAAFVIYGVNAGTLPSISLSGDYGGAVLPSFIVDWICIIVVTGGLIYTFSDKKDKTNKKD
jgi:hypothetical protein